MLVKARLAGLWEFFAHSLERLVDEAAGDAGRERRYAVARTDFPLAEGDHVEGIIEHQV